MNSGLPSLLDAIFGKQDLALVSLDEIYEVIREFPSFNAGHFLLAKKLRLQDDPGYNTESMRTALYFNNPFWLQSLLEDGNHLQPVESFSHVKEVRDEDQFIFEGGPEETLNIIQEEGNYTFESYTPFEQPVKEKDELDEEMEEILEEKLNSDPASEETFQYAEPGSQTVTSFDELMAKYHLQPLDLVDENFKLPDAETEHEKSAATIPDFKFPDAGQDPDKNITKDDDQNGGFEEVVNEYGIFEEIVVRKTDHDHDLDAIDRTLDQIPFVSEKIVEEAAPSSHSINTLPAETTEQMTVVEDTMNTADSTSEQNIGTIENEDISEIQESENAPHQTDEHDYDAYDRPREEPVQAEVLDNEKSDEFSENDPDNTGEPDEYSNDTETEANGQMQELSERFDEHQQSLSAFNAKNADSIVFTPYHMVDYFASQGIKLTLEDNPPDQFGKQLKSFTAWLKVMKKLPLQHTSGKEDEKVNEQIRHFAAHSIEERDVLTESMAEVLAKQGMYENAIALFQKLSLIYPPKSAYFASRIEQLKASLS